MTFWRDRDGKELTFQEFMSRWKEGIEGITPLQQTNTQLWGSTIMIIGILAGIIVSIVAFNNLWWVMIILIGALINSLIQFLGVLQKRIALKRIETIMEGGATE